MQNTPIRTDEFTNMRKRIEEFECNRIHNGETDCGVDNTILEVWNNIPDTSYSVEKLAISLLTISSSTYTRESLFSVLNHWHSKTGNRLTTKRFGSAYHFANNSVPTRRKKPFEQYKAKGY